MITGLLTPKELGDLIRDHQQITHGVPPGITPLPALDDPEQSISLPSERMQLERPVRFPPASGL